MQSSGGGPVSTLFTGTDKGFGPFLERIPLYPEGLRFIRQDAAVFGGADDFGDDDAELLDLINGRIRAVPGVRSTETFVYLKLRKQIYTWGTR